MRFGFVESANTGTKARVRKHALASVSVAFFALSSAPAMAEGVGGFVAFGPALTPEFEGSEDYELVPGFFGQVTYEGYSATLTPSDLDIDLIPSPMITLGPSFTYRFAREDVENDQVDLLNDVDAAAEIGANFALNYGGLMDENDGLSLGLRLTQDVADGHGGFVGRASANYMYPLTQRLMLTGGIEMTAVSDDYAESYFSVTAAEAARSGLSAYDAGGGLKDVKFTAMADYSLTDNWGIGGYVSYARMVGDFADSSIVDEAGSPNQWFGMLAARYAF